MKKSAFVLAIAGLAFVVTSAGRLPAAVIPPIGLSPGSPYQLIFVTADSTQATSSNIGDYNSFVQTEALASSSSVVQNATWAAIVSTADVGPSNAPVNAPSDGTYPVYNTAGQLVEPAGISYLYGGIASLLQNSPDYDQNGNLNESTVWSGTSVFGELVPGSTYLMGQAAPIVGIDNQNAVVGQWLDNFETEPDTNSYPIYAPSAPIMSPVPEPGTFILFGIGVIGLFILETSRVAKLAEGHVGHRMSCCEFRACRSMCDGLTTSFDMEKPVMTAPMQKKNCSRPDETREFPNGRVDLVTLGGVTFGRATLEPGWKWSTSLKPVVKTNSCEASHLQYHVAGRLAVRMDDGSEAEFGPGDVSLLPPGHDAWVVGNEPAVIIDIAGMGNYAKSK